MMPTLCITNFNGNSIDCVFMFFSSIDGPVAYSFYMYLAHVFHWNLTPGVWHHHWKAIFSSGDVARLRAMTRSFFHSAPRVAENPADSPNPCNPLETASHVPTVLQMVPSRHRRTQHRWKRGIWWFSQMAWPVRLGRDWFIFWLVVWNIFYFPIYWE